MGYEYLYASNKEEFQAVVGKFLNPKITAKPILFEIFTETQDESNALKTALNTIVDPKTKMKGFIKKAVKNIVGENELTKMKEILKK